MKQIPIRSSLFAKLINVLHLYSTVEAVVEHNVAKLHDLGQPFATIKAVHTGANAAKGSPDDAGGLEAIICIANSARVMLISNLWVKGGLGNGVIGTIKAICYQNGGPHDLPLAVPLCPELTLVTCELLQPMPV